jgi:hypothetical protein
MDEQTFTSSVETGGRFAGKPWLGSWAEKNRKALDLSTTRILVANNLPCNYGMQGTWGAGPCAMGADYYVGRSGRRYACY